MVLDEIELAVQINSKMRAKITVPSGASKEEIEKRHWKRSKTSFKACPRKLSSFPADLSTSSRNTKIGEYAKMRIQIK